MRLAVAVLSAALALPAMAHDGVTHGTSREAAAHAGAPTPALPFPVDITARFALTDQDGNAVTERDFAGRPMAVFFGYANCEAICSVALPRMGAALDILGEKGAAIAPLMITVDPRRDTVATMGPALAKFHPRLRGLTGSDEALAAARAAFQVDTADGLTDADGNPVYSHGSFIYLIGADGKVRTVLPPILGPERMAEIIGSYL